MIKKLLCILCMPFAYLLGSTPDYDIYKLNDLIDFADDMLTFKNEQSLLHTLDQLHKLNDLVDFADDTVTFKYKQSLPPEFWRMRFYVYPNTFIWYKWEDYDKAIGFKKIYILEEIKSLTTDRN